MADIKKLSGRESAPAAKPLAKPGPASSSLQRKTHELAVTLFYGMWRTLFSYFGRVHHTRAMQEKIHFFDHQPDEYKQKHPEIYNSIDTLRKKQNLTPTVVRAYLEQLPGLQVATHFLFRLPDPSDLPQEALPKREKDKNLIAIPVVLEGGLLSRNHVVAILVDLKHRKIEFYDPKGLTIEDRKGQPLLAWSKGDLSSLIDKIKQKYDIEAEPLENEILHQKDSHNCGVYVSNFFKQRSEGKDFADIIQHRKTFSQANNALRREILEPLLPDPLNVELDIRGAREEDEEPVAKDYL